MTTTEPALYPIGEVAQRTGLSVSTIRYYSDEGLVRPTEVTDSGHRLYDVEAIARLELVRTLRDLDAGLEQVRRVLTGATSLPDLLTEHLDITEKRTTELQAKRAVLRALVREQSTAQRASLLRKLVTMSDTDRQHLIDDFWDDVSDGLSHAGIERIRGARPQLPPDPAPEQLDAWLTLAELLRDEQFRGATRAYLHETYATGPGAEVSEQPVQEFIHSDGADLTSRLIAAHRAGLRPDDPHVADLATQLVERTTQAVGVTVDNHVRQRMAAGYNELEAVFLSALEDPDYSTTEGRYLELVAIINDEPHPHAGLFPAARRDPSGGADIDLRNVGQWLSAAILATDGPVSDHAADPSSRAVR